jgi:PleD family two-component response regulator
MEDRTIKLLLIEPDPGDAMFLKEALLEIEERQYGRAWSPVFRPVHVERLSDALEVLATERFDAALVDIVLPDSHSLHAFLRLRAIAPEMAILLLAGEDDEALAVSAVREGAQDYLVKPELDCAPLARAIRHAIERQRVATSVRSATFQDAETGFYNAAAFHLLAQRDLGIARKLGCNLYLVLVELDGLDRIEGVYGRAERRMVLIEAAEAVRESSRPNDMVGRLDENRFAIASLGSEPAGARFPRQLRMGFRVLSSGRGRRCGIDAVCGHASLRDSGARDWESLLAAAEKSLCENERRPAPRETAEHPAVA